MARTSYTDPPLLPLQKKILKDVHSKRYREVLFSAPRGNGKTYLAAQAIADVIWPESPHYAKGLESIVVSGDKEQAGLIMQELHWIRDATDEDGKLMYRWRDTENHKRIEHKVDGTRMRVVSSKATGALGLGANHALIIADEPGAWEAREGEDMQEALLGALGKPGSQMVIFWVGTVAPAKGGWWAAKVAAGTRARCKAHVWALTDESKWRHAREVKRVNPLRRSFPDSLKDLMDEFAETKGNPSKEIFFKNWRLNMNLGSKRTVLLTADTVELMLSRPAPERTETYMLALDLGDNIAFSAATGIWSNGRIECLAMCSEFPTIAEREHHDGKPKGAYQRLVDAGLLHIVGGRHSVNPEDIIGLIDKEWGEPEKMVADRFRERKLMDASIGWAHEFRVNQWSDSTYDIEALRSMAADGPLAVVPKYWPLLSMSLADARVKTDENQPKYLKYAKKDSNNTGRDDVAITLSMAAGLYHREMSEEAPTLVTL